MCSFATVDLFGNLLDLLEAGAHLTCAVLDVTDSALQIIVYCRIVYQFAKGPLAAVYL